MSRKALAAPHRFREVGGRVLAVDEARRWALVSKKEHAAYLAGRPLAALDAFARVDGEGAALASLAGWRGPRRLALLLERGGVRLAVAKAKAAVDFIFSSPSPGLVVELVARDVGEVRPVLRFCVEYAQRRAEWGRRRLSLVARAQARAENADLDWLAARGVERRTVLTLSGAPRRGELPAFSAQTARALVAAPAAQAAAWMDWLDAAGLRSVLLEPAADGPAGRRAFLAFYAAALERLAELEGPLLDESLRAHLAEPRWALPGLDVLEELACDERGELFTSERAALLPESGRRLFSLGPAGETRLSELAGLPAVRAALAAAEPENQPLCRSCAYAAFCALAASQSYAEQGTVWGRMPQSSACALVLGRLDAVFALSDCEKGRDLLNKHSVDSPW